jgi:hypothetical protein
MKEWMNRKNITYMVITLMAVIISVILCVDYAVNGRQGLVGRAAGSSSKNVNVTIQTRILKDGLENMGFLVTQEYYFTQVETYTKEKTFLKFLTSSSEFVYSYDGKVYAGVDFSKIDISTEESEKTIHVKLPAAEIQSVSIDRDTFQIYSEKDHLWNELTLEDYNASLEAYEVAALEQAQANGILERADEQARVLVTNFVHGFEEAVDYKVVFD